MAGLDPHGMAHECKSCGCTQDRVPRQLTETCQYYNKHAFGGTLKAAPARERVPRPGVPASDLQLQGSHRRCR